MYLSYVLLIMRGCIVADISEFYPSIYTHTIPWAFHGKAFANANIGNSALIENELDRLTRVGQEGQTVKNSSRDR